MAEFEIKGARELHKLLNELPTTIERKVLRGGLRAAGVEIEREAKARAPVDSGQLRESIRTSTGSKRGGYVYAHVKVGGRRKGDAFYAHMVEYGTKPHEIKPKNFPSLFVAGVFRAIVQHPGAKAKPFLRPAFDTKVNDAIKAFSDYVGERLEKLAAKKI